MISTTLTALLLTAGLNTSAIPNLESDYSRALVSASTSNKPMAVFIGQGSDKLRQMFAEGRISSESVRVLRESYVCVYLDTDSGAGKELADRFSMPEGLVINTPSGSVQALRHSGAVGGSDLTRELSQYSTGAVSVPTAVATTTPAVVSTPVNVAQAYGVSSPFIMSGTCPGGNCRAVTAPTYAVPGTTSVAAPGYTLQAAPSYGFPTSSCPNGRCPNQR